VSVGAAPVLPGSVAGADGPAPAELVSSPALVVGAVLPASVPALGPAGAVAAGGAEAVVSVPPVGSDAGGVVVGLLEAVGDAVGAADGFAPESPEDAAGESTGGFDGEPAGDVIPPVPAPGFMVGVEVAPPDVVAVLEGVAAGAPTGVALTVSADGDDGDGDEVPVGPAAGAPTGGAVRAGTEASSCSRAVGGAEDR
jgi:hypothetical protein